MSGIVVDSSLPVDEAPVDEIPGDEIPGDETPVEEGDAGEETPPVVDPMQELAESVGLDPAQLSGFKDVDTARSAITNWLESQRQLGRQTVQYETPPPVVSTPSVPAQPTIVQEPSQIDLKAIGLDETDPAAKAIRALEQQQATYAQVVQGLQQNWEQTQAAATNQRKAELQSQALNIADEWASPLYGVGQERNALQSSALDMVFDMANDFAKAEWRTQANQGIPESQRKLSPLKVRMRRAKVSLEHSLAPAAPPAPGKSVLTETTKPSAAPKLEIGYGGSWSENPEFRRALRNL